MRDSCTFLTANYFCGGLCKMRFGRNIDSASLKLYAAEVKIEKGCKNQKVRNIPSLTHISEAEQRQQKNSFPYNTCIFQTWLPSCHFLAKKE